MKLYFKLMWKFLKFSLPVLLLLLPVLAVSGIFLSWESDEEILKGEYSSHIAVLSGYSYQSTTHEGITSSSSQRSYWLIPKTIESPQMLSITYQGSGGVKHEASKDGFWFSVATYILIIIASYYVWVRGYDPFNK